MPFHTVGSPLTWGAFLLGVLVLLALDLGLLNRNLTMLDGPNDQRGEKKREYDDADTGGWGDDTSEIPF